ncbi:type II toxin-antitoxin system HicB family antitoxin [uncultured Adlercreutzia sp.]|uniref:type II toxin-antitoxin system HicB family antitoxin n=1 Tax=uncultured Adlercreutzia sp. TaxID=875803 RepID=UPI0026F3A208|nr:type II toxin-antitoxin system HicB family antitoxin [uncultured Adlercreutzia sp.]
MASRAEDYAYRVLWSQEDGAYVATVAEFPSLSCVEENQADAFFGIVDVVTAVLEDMSEAGEEIPVPFSNRHYSGKFALRIPPEKHRQLAIEAAEQHVSLNQLVVSRL